MDTFFSGSSDVVLPEGGSRRPPAEVDPTESDLEAHAPYFCERCDESIPLAELAAGRARLVTGLAFCARCSPLLEEERYQIYFCDSCGVSIPLERIEGGKALAGDGHVYCVRCRRRSPRLARRFFLPGLALLVVAGAVVLLVPSLRSSPEAAPPPPRFPEVLRATRDRMARRLDDAEAAALRRRLAFEHAVDDDYRTSRNAVERLASRLREIRGSTGGGDSTQPPAPDRR